MISLGHLLFSERKRRRVDLGERGFVEREFGGKEGEKFGEVWVDIWKEKGREVRRKGGRREERRKEILLNPEI